MGKILRSHGFAGADSLGNGGTSHRARSSDCVRGYPRLKPCDFLLGAKFPVSEADGLVEGYARYRRNETAAADLGCATQLLSSREVCFAAFAHDYATML